MANAVVQKTFRLPEDIARALAALASRERTSENHEAITALRAHIDASKRGKR